MASTSGCGAARLFRGRQIPAAPYEADVVRIDERSHHQERSVMRLPQEIRARLRQLRPLIAIDLLEARGLDRHGHMLFAAIDRFVTRFGKYLAHRARQYLRRDLGFLHVFIGLDPDPAGQRPGQHAEPRRNAHGIGAIGQRKPRTCHRQAPSSGSSRRSPRTSSSHPQTADPR